MDTFLALADPTRRGIVDILAAGPLPAGDISSQFDISAPAISQHLKVLREARIVTTRVDAQRRIYQLDPRGFREVDEWLARYRRFWITALDTLESQLQADLQADRNDSRKERRKKSKSKGKKK